mmetsp:Transcript_2332/g.4896  ORF Transcript_2332/g.4896 Transcript_2332/m.4896 type:complete len:425 (-) Transcript_2332:252-1526(-)
MRTPLPADWMPQDNESEFDFQVEECLNGLAKRGNGSLWSMSASNAARPRPTLFTEKRELETEVVAVQRASEQQQNELSAHLRQLTDQCNEGGRMISDLTKACEDTWNDAQLQMQAAADRKAQLEEELASVQREREALAEVREREEAQASLKVRTTDKSLSKLLTACETLQEKVQTAKLTREVNLYDAETERLARRELETAAECEMEACRENMSHTDADSDTFSSKVASNFLRRKPMDRPQLQKEADSLLSRIQATRDAKRQVQVTLESETAMWFLEVQTMKAQLQQRDEEAGSSEMAMQEMTEEHLQRDAQKEELIAEVENLSELIREVDNHAETSIAASRRLDSELNRAKGTMQVRQTQRDQVRQLQAWLEAQQEQLAAAEEELAALHDEFDARTKGGLLSCLRTRPSGVPASSSGGPSRVGR